MIQIKLHLNHCCLFCSHCKFCFFIRHDYFISKQWTMHLFANRKRARDVNRLSFSFCISSCTVNTARAFCFRSIVRGPRDWNANIRFILFPIELLICMFYVFIGTARTTQTRHHHSPGCVLAWCAHNILRMFPFRQPQTIAHPPIEVACDLQNIVVTVSEESV